MSLFWRVFAANAAILTAGTLVLAFAPGPLHEHRALIDLSGLLIGLLFMLVVNGILLRRLFRPLEQLAGQMEAADVLRGGQRVPEVSSGEIGTLERAFNQMLERLESERRDAGAYALTAQEEERQARELQLGDGDRIGFDYLILATGLQADFRGIPGAAEQLQEQTSYHRVRRGAGCECGSFASGAGTWYRVVTGP